MSNLQHTLIQNIRGTFIATLILDLILKSMSNCDKLRLVSFCVFTFMFISLDLVCICVCSFRRFVIFALHAHHDRRSPDANSQDVGSEKFFSGSGTPNSGNQTPGQTQERTTPSSPSKSATAARSPRSPTHPPEPTHNYETTFDLDGNVETASLSSSRDGNR